MLTSTILFSASSSKSGNPLAVLAVSVARVGVMASIFMALRQICRSEGEGMEATGPLGGRAVAWT